MSNKVNSSSLENYVPKSNIVFESIALVRFGTSPGAMYIDLFGGASTYYRLELNNANKKIAFRMFDGSNMSTFFEK
ncbi:hypothetical protein [Lacrimispora sp.]|uniref:hypothetical protein n=1 Tax=Lacrimispora sp. TaxID=2719234 RepID=UPI0039E4B71C